MGTRVGRVCGVVQLAGRRRSCSTAAAAGGSMKGFTPYSGAFRQNSWAQLFLLQPIFSAIAACVPPSVDSNMLTCASTFILFLLSLSIALASDPVLSLLPVLL